MNNKLKLLIIDDDRGDRTLMRKSIENAGLYVDFNEAKDGAEGITKVKQLKPNVVVVLDTLMPDMDGFTACKKIKEVDDNIKVVICTGFIDAVDAGKARAAGADEYCVKTENYEALIEAVRNLVIA